MIRLVVLDAPTSKGRPRFNRQSGRVYTPAKTTNAEARIRHAWDVAGRPTIPEGTPIRMRIELYVDRPMPDAFLILVLSEHGITAYRHDAVEGY